MTTPALTAQEADERSHARSQKNRRRLDVIAVFVLAVFVCLALMLQAEQARLSNALDQMCRQRQANALKAVAYYDGMVAIERENKVQVPDLVARRIALWEQAKPDVPSCD